MLQTTIAISGLVEHLKNLIKDQRADEARKYYTHPFRCDVRQHAKKDENIDTIVDITLSQCIQRLDIEFAKDTLETDAIGKELDLIEKNWEPH